MALEMRVSELTFDDLADVPIVWLRSDAGHAMTVCVGVVEATALALSIERDEPAQSAQELPGRLLEALGAEVRSLEIHAMDGARFLARVTVANGTREAPLDCRPADVFALALRFDLPIWVHDDVWIRVSATPSEASRPSTEWTEYLQQLDEHAFGKYKM